MKVMDLIPQVFYDAIARIVPGILLLISTAIIFAKPLSEAWTQYKTIFLQMPATLAMGTIIVSYALSIVVEGIHNDTKKIRLKLDKLQKRPSGREQRNEIWRDAWKDFCKAHPSREGMKPPRPPDAVAIDAIRLFDPAVGSRIVKLRAEVAFCRTLSTGWMALLILYFVYITGVLLDRQQISLLIVVLTVALLLLGIRSIASRHITIDSRHIRALYNHWLLLINPGPPNESDKLLEHIGANDKHLPAVIIPFDSFKKDTQLGKDNVGSRKLLVTELWDSIEEHATDCYWQPPNEGDKNAVLKTSNIEIGIFTHHAPQDRHFHILGTEIYSVIEGEMSIGIEEDTHTLQRGDTIVVRPGTIHKVQESNSFLCQVISANCHGKYDKFVAKEDEQKKEI